MSGRSFIDTNVLVYTDAADDPRRRDLALAVLAHLRRAGTGVLSTQVLQGYYAAATRKLAVPAATAQRKVELFAQFEVVQVDVPLLLAAIDLQQLHRLSFWDALIVQSALAAGCPTLLSDDLQAGARLRGLRVTNPFDEPGDAVHEVPPVPYRAARSRRPTGLRGSP